MSDLSGFAETEKLTFSKYTSAPVRGLRYTFTCPDVKSAEEYDAIDWSTPLLTEDIPPFPKIVQIPVEHLREVKTRFLPVSELDLSAMAAVGLLPKTFEYSRPDVNPQSKSFAIASLNVNSLADIHKAIYHVTLANLHYCYRLRAFLYEWGLLQRHPDSMVDMVPGMDDLAAKDLLEQEAGNASQRMWYRAPIFNDEEKDDSLGFASWLWADTGIIEALEGGQKFQASGSVLFTFAPYWIMPRGEMDLLSDADNERSKPDWLTGIHAFCRESGTHHVIVYNGDSVVLGIFDASFDEVKFSPNLWVNVQRYGRFGYGMDVTGLEYISPERMGVSLVQVLTQVMADAKASQIVPVPATEATATDSAHNTLTTTLPFPFAPIGKNSGQPKLTGTKAETEYAMRFSRRTNFHQPWPTREECEREGARLREAREQKNNEIVAPAPALAPAPAAVSHTTQALRALSPALATYSSSSSSGSLKRQRDEEGILPSFPRQTASVLHLRCRLRATRSIRAAPTRNSASGPATDRHSATIETRSNEELLRPTKRLRTVAPITPPIPVTPAAVPQTTPALADTSAQPLPSASGSLKRQRADESTPPTPTRSHSPAPYFHPRLPCTPVAERQCTAAASAASEVLSDDEMSPPEKRPRITAPAATNATVAHPDEGPLATRRPIRHAAKHGTTYAERQVKLADASDSKKRDDLRNKVKAAKATQSTSRRLRMPVTNANYVEDELVYKSANGGDRMEGDEPQPTALPAPKAKTVAASKTARQMKKAVAAKDSSKKAMIQAKTKATKAKTATRTAVVAQASSNDPSKGVYLHLRSRAVPVLVEANQDDEQEPPVARGKGKSKGKEKGKGVPTRRQPPRK
ncbi:hypothetical protein FRB93_010865 [Tulasnella sp. JGI-2019a]|nr:hypothetical protein FRB93_010865 [Tulasnella sp. JGI-2019a]